MAENENWERTVLEKLALAVVKEQRRARQWGVLFKLLTLILLFLVFFALMGWLKGKEKFSTKHTAMVEIHGDEPLRIIPIGRRCLMRKTQAGPMPNITSGFR